MGASMSRWGRRPRAGAAPVRAILAAAVLVAGLFTATSATVRGETGGATHFDSYDNLDPSVTAGTPCSFFVEASDAHGEDSITAGTGGLSYYPIAPVRVLDSSVSLGLSGTFASRSARLFTIVGTGGVPTGAAGISGNLTVLSPSSAGWALVSPETVATPTTSTLNVASGHSEANGFDVALGASGHVALDITGYWK